MTKTNKSHGLKGKASNNPKGRAKSAEPRESKTWRIPISLLLAIDRKIEAKQAKNVQAFAVDAIREKLERMD